VGSTLCRLGLALLSLASHVLARLGVLGLMRKLQHHRRPQWLLQRLQAAGLLQREQQQQQQQQVEQQRGEQQQGAEQQPRAPSPAAEPERPPTPPSSPLGEQLLLHQPAPLAGSPAAVLAVGSPAVLAALGGAADAGPGVLRSPTSPTLDLLEIIQVWCGCVFASCVRMCACMRGSACAHALGL